MQNCKISRDIKKRNFLVIQDFLQIAINIDFRVGKKIVEYITNNQLLKHESGGVNITPLLIRILHKYLQFKQFPESVIKHTLEIRKIKKKCRKRKEDDLAEEYNAFIINPLAYTRYEKFDDVIRELKKIPDICPPQTIFLIKLIHGILLDLISKYLHIEKFSKRLEKHSVLIKSYSISSIPLFNMQRDQVENRIKETKEIDISIYELLKNLILKRLELSEDVIEFIRYNIWTHIKYKPFKKLFLSICIKVPHIFRGNRQSSV